MQTFHNTVRRANLGTQICQQDNYIIQVWAERKYDIMEILHI